MLISVKIKQEIQETTANNWAFKTMLLYIVVQLKLSSPKM